MMRFLFFVLMPCGWYSYALRQLPCFKENTLHVNMRPYEQVNQCALLGRFVRNMDNGIRKIALIGWAGRLIMVVGNIEKGSDTENGLPNGWPQYARAPKANDEVEVGM